MIYNVKEKFVGILLIIIAIFPFFLKTKFFSEYKFLEQVAPGTIAYQVILAILGVLLLWQARPRYYR